MVWRVLPAQNERVEHVVDQDANGAGQAFSLAGVVPEWHA